MQRRSTVANPSQPAPARIRRLWIACILFAVASALAGYLAWVSLSGGSVAGCGLQSSCHRVLQSRWAYWLRIPVSLPAMAVYLFLAAGLQRRVPRLRAPETSDESRWLAPLSLVVIAAAIWFGLLQIFVLRAFCMFCLSAHAAATAAALIVVFDSRAARATSGQPRPRFRNTILVSALGIAALISGQVLVTKSTNTIRTLATPALAPAEHQAGRIVALHDGRFQLDLAAVPRIGPVSAPHVVVALFDYTCPHCRDLHEHLVRAQKRFGDQLAIVTLPVPLDARCNPLVSQTASDNMNACDYARLGLAIWRAKPEAFVSFTSWLFAPARPPSIEAVRRHAENLVGAEALRTALDDGWIHRQIRADIELFEANSKRAGAWQMPQLLMGRAISVGAVQSADALYTLLHEHLGLKNDE